MGEKRGVAEKSINKTKYKVWPCFICCWNISFPFIWPAQQLQVFLLVTEGRRSEISQPLVNDGEREGLPATFSSLLIGSSIKYRFKERAREIHHVPDTLKPFNHQVLDIPQLFSFFLKQSDSTDDVINVIAIKRESGFTACVT